ncbi:MAG: DUF4870 domain-containing protein, partial [Polaribacter sp.]
FNLSYTLYAFIVTIAVLPFTFSALFRHFRNFNNLDNINIHFDFNNFLGFMGLGSIAGIIYLVGIALVIIASLKVKKGENYKYPFTIKFVK